MQVLAWVTALPLLSAMMFFAPLPVFAKGLFTGRVVNVVDGDTVDIRLADDGVVRIRLSGIDAPESLQAFGAESKKSLSNLLFEREVEVRWHKAEWRGRYVGKVLVGGSDSGLLQVARGYAWHYKQFEKEQSHAERLSYAAAETGARKRGLGLWRATNPVPPWEWRKLTPQERRDRK